ncbi:hypothetical protein Tco_1212283 [Tanacetum coccineum]
MKFHHHHHPQHHKRQQHKKGEYDIWAMKMEHYLAHTDYLIWEVIQNGNGPVSITTDTQGQIKVLPPRTAEEILARERERKARTTLLMALPEDHLAKFHKMTDAKEMWDAIKSRFGGNDESKKMQKYILKQQFEGFFVSNSEGLHKGYDRFQILLSQLEVHGAGVSTEDANQKFLRSLPSAWSQLRVFENDVKGSTASSSSTQNIAFVSENTSSTNDVSIAYNVSTPSGQNSQIKGNQDSRRRDAWNSGNKDGRRSGKQEDSKALVTIDGEGSDTEVTSCSNECKESYAKLKKLYDAQREQLSDASIEIKAYTQEAQKEKEDLKAKVEKWHTSSKNLGKLLNTQMSANDKFGARSQPSESDFDTCESDCSVETYESLTEPTVNEPKVVNQPKVWSDAPIIEEYKSDSEDEHVSQPTKEQEQPSFASTIVKHQVVIKLGWNNRERDNRYPQHVRCVVNLDVAFVVGAMLVVSFMTPLVPQANLGPQLHQASSLVNRRPNKPSAHNSRLFSQVLYKVRLKRLIP